MGEYEKIPDILGKRPGVFAATPALLPDYSRYRSASETGPYAYLKIAAGCFNLCACCAIPAIRGSFRSRPVEDMVEELLSFMKKAQFERAGGFKYSREEGTAAYAIKGQVPERIKEERFGLIMEAQREISLEKNLSSVGKTLDILIEGESEESQGLFVGRHRGQPLKWTE
jgi:tRNA A37 methylthiotransferase MiaB